MAVGSPIPLLPEQASDLAVKVDQMFWYLTIFSTAITLLVCLLVAYFSVRYRRRTEDEVPPEPVTHRWAEVIAAGGLFVVFLSMFFWGAVVYIQMKRPAPHALEINVIGKQWMWKTQHPGGQREINALHLPLGVPVKLVMTSQDVIHSFGIPAFRVKQDVLPGSYSTQWFTPTKIGEFHLFCQEYCGTDHSSMIGKIVVLQPKDYEAWLAGITVDEPPEAVGARLFTSYGCLQCHGQVAPTLAGLYGRRVRLSDGSTVQADDAYLRESIVNPAAKIVAGYPPTMPSYRGQLTEEQLSALTAYIRSLATVRADDPRNTPDASAPPSLPPSSPPASPPASGLPPAPQVSPWDSSRLPPRGQPPANDRPPLRESNK